MSNGLELRDAVVRFFGIGGGARRDLIEWNRFETWKFAWPASVSEYLFFGEDVWGNQFGYRFEDLRSGQGGSGSGAPVVFVSPIYLNPGPLGDDFGAYLRQGLLHNARAGVDALERAAFERLGVPGVDEHLVYIPPILLGGEEAPERAVRMPARTAMIAAGDVFTQASAVGFEREAERIETVVDDHGRTRVKVVWRER